MKNNSFFKFFFRKLYYGLFSTLEGSGLSKYALIRNVHSFFSKNLKSENVVFYNFQFFLSQNDEEGYSNGISYLDDYLPLLQKLIQPGDILVDVGAKIGFYSLAFCNMIGKTGHVYSFEPTPDSFNILKKNKSINQIDNLTIEQKAVSNIRGSRILEISKFSGLNRINDYASVGIKVESIKLDDYFKDIQKISLIKIDVEGHELEVLLGATKILNLFKPKILFEYNTKLFEKNNSRQILLFLQEMGYHFYDLEQNENLERDISYFKTYENKQTLTNILAKI